MPSNNQYHIQLTRNRIKREESEYRDIIKGISKTEQSQCEQLGQDIAQATRHLVYQNNANPDKIRAEYENSVSALLDYLMQHQNKYPSKTRKFLSTYYSNHEYDICDLTVNLMEKTYSARKEKLRLAEEERQKALAALEQEDAEEEDTGDSDNPGDLTTEDLESLFSDPDDWFSDSDS